MAECPNYKVLADIAIQTIANHRKSSFFIRNSPFGATGSLARMDVKEAYDFLEIGSHDVDDSSVEAAYISAKAEPTKDQNKVTEAIDLIIDHRDSGLLRALIEQQGQPHRDPSEWPVGLTNIGNTCYLNSMLQYFFSIKPFRHLVLNFEMFLIDLNNEAEIQDRRVAERKIKKKEIEDGINRKPQ